MNAGPKTISPTEMGTSATAESRAPSFRSSSTAEVSPRAADRLIRGISAVSSDTPRMP